MEKSGITRRIDSLGRIVIPKEIRKCLKISDSDEMNVSVINNEIVITKSDSIETNKVISLLIYTLSREIKKNVLLTSCNKIIEKCLIDKNNYQDITLSDYTLNVIKKRKNLFNDLSEVNLFNKKELLSFLIHPLIVNGDLVGSLIVFHNSKFTKEEISIINFIQKFLENYLE